MDTAWFEIIFHLVSIMCFVTIFHDLPKSSTYEASNNPKPHFSNVIL